MESEYSVIESVEDNGAIGGSENLDSSGESVNKADGNNESGGVDGDKQLGGGDDVKDKTIDTETQPVKSSPRVVPLSLGGDEGSASPSSDKTRKGYGLRKWRRIKREVTKDGAVSVDTSKLLKRALPNVGIQPEKSMQFSAELRETSEGSVSSTDAVVDGFAVVGDSRLGMQPMFASGIDSENSEERSSKSSKGPNVPRLRYEGHVVGGHSRDKHKMKSLSGKNLVSSAQQLHQVKVRTDTSKKPRGGGFKIEKENSHSSMESDSRSSNFVFVQGANSLTSNGRLDGRSIVFDEGNSDEARGAEVHVGAGLQTGYGQRNDGDYEDIYQADIAAASSSLVEDENSESQTCSTDRDPWADSICLLQSTEEALVKVVQEYREIGNEDFSLDDSSPNSCGDRLEDHSPSSLHVSESEINNLKDNINVLKSKLDETTALLKVKESKVIELEAVLSCQSLGGDLRNARNLNSDNNMDYESDLESLFRQKIEAEVQFLMLSRTVDILIDSTHDLTDIQEELGLLDSDLSELQHKLGSTASTAVTLEKHAKQLKNYGEDITSADETLKLQSSMYKYSSCFLIQLILLAVVLGLVFLQASSRSSRFVPT